MNVSKAPPLPAGLSTDDSENSLRKPKSPSSLSLNELSPPSAGITALLPSFKTGSEIFESWYKSNPIQIPTFSTVEKTINAFTAVAACGLFISIIYYMNQHISNLNQQITDVSQKYEQEKSARSEVQLNFEDVEAQRDDLSKTLAQISPQFEVITKANKVSVEQLQVCIKDLHDAKDHLRKFNDWNVSLQKCLDFQVDINSPNLIVHLKEAKDVWRECSSKQEEVDLLDLSLKAMSKYNTELESELSEATNQCTADKQGLQDEIDSQKQSNEALSNNNQNLDKEIAQLKESLKESQDRVRDLEKDNEKYEKELEEMTTAVRKAITKKSKR